MSAVLLVFQFVLSIVLTGLILVQRSEGGALGIGGGGGGLMSGRSATDNIVKATAVLGAVFVINCVALTVVFNMENRDASILERAGVERGSVERAGDDVRPGRSQRHRARTTIGSPRLREPPHTQAVRADHRA